MGVGGVFAANVWVHVALTYDKVSGWARLYRDGVMMAEQNFGVFTARNYLPAGVGGASGATTSTIEGALDEISLYTRPLTITRGRRDLRGWRDGQESAGR
jgi:hypothetical protein